MEPSSIANLIIGILSTIFGGGVVAFYNARVAAKIALVKQKADIQTAENIQALEIYKNVMQSLKESVFKTGEDIQKLEKEHLLCREENINLKVEIKYLKSDIEKITKELEEIKKRVNG